MKSTTRYVALLRAVNVGGTGKLPMQDLVAICEDAGFTDLRTYIASGNAVFTSRLKEPAVKAALEKRLAAYAGRPVGVCVRSGAEMADVLANNPFRGAPPNGTVAIFLDAAPPSAAAPTSGSRSARARSTSRTARAWRARSYASPRPRKVRRAT